nr:hypothetical protein [Tanacetum cinerariifolium]
TITTTIKQQVALDEALVPSAQRLRIGRSNFRLPLDIQSKEPTLQVVYDVLRRSPFFKAFLVMADVPEIYIQEFWATAKRSFAAVINKCLTGKRSGIDSLRLSQAQILWGLYHRRNIDYAFLIWEDFVYQVEHNNQKKSNEMYYPRFTKVIIYHFMKKKPLIPRRNKVNWHYVRDDILFSTIKVVSRHQDTQQYGTILPIELTTEDIRNTMAYKEYYACATGEAAPKPKASARKKKGGSASSTTPLTPIATPTPTTTVVAALRLSAAAKGKQPARATSHTDPSDVEQTEAEQLKIVLRRSRQETHISQQRGSSTDEGTGSKPGVPDVPFDDSEEEISWNSSDDEDVDDQTMGSDDKEDSEDDGNNEEDQGLRIGEEERIREEEEADELYRMESIFTTGSSTVTPIPSPQSTMTPSIIAASTTPSQLPITPTLIPRLDLQSLPTFASVFRFEDRVKSLEVNFSDISEMELKKILIEKMEGNKSIQQSDEQQNLYKALVEAYNADKTILDTYGESAILKRRREDDDQEGPFAGSDRGSTTGTQSRQLSASESTLVEEPVQTTCQMEEPSHLVFETGAEDPPIVQTSQHPEWFSQPRKPPTPDRDWNITLPVVQGNAQSWISELAKQTDARSSFNELLDTPINFSNFIMNRLGVDTLTPKLLAGPTYELLRGSCDFKRLRLQDIEDMLLLLVQGKLSNLTVEERFAFNVSLRMFTRSIVIQRRRREAYTAHSNPRGFIYQNKDKKNRLMRIDELHIFSDGTLNDVRNALDDRLKGIRMQYLPTTIWRKRDKDRAAAMIQAIDKMLKTKRIMRSLERFVGGRQYEGDLRMLQRTI